MDVWAGTADRRTGRPYEHDTATVIFSCTKGVMAICAYLLVQEGRLDLDAPIARYWPEFAQAGKERITVRDAMAHRAGLAYLDTDLTLDDVVAWDPVIHAIEVQAPHHAPTDGHAYHASTIGWLLGEVIRRITGLSAGANFRRALGDPLGLNTWIGIPDAERSHVAWMEPPLPDDDSEFAKGFASFGNDPRIIRTMSLGKAFAFPSDDGQVTFNNPVIQAAEIPGAGGISSAESLAKLYAACVTGVDGGSPLLTPRIDRRRAPRPLRRPAAHGPAGRRRPMGDRLPDLLGAGAAAPGAGQLRAHRRRRPACLRRRGLRCELRVRQQPDGRVRRRPGAVARRGPADGPRWLTRPRHGDGQAVCRPGSPPSTTRVHAESCMKGDVLVIEAHHRRAAAQIAADLVDAIHAKGGRFVVTVAGESGSGKSETAAALAEQLLEVGVASVVLGQDDYFILPPRSNDARRRSDPDWLGPHVEVRFDLLQANVDAALAGASEIEKPVIDYDRQLGGDGGGLAGGRRRS